MAHFGHRLGRLALVSVAAAAAWASGAAAQSAAPPAPPAAPAKPVAAEGEFPADWFWDIGGSAARFAPMVGKPPPPLSVTGWVGPARDLAALKGKVVVVDFWGTWCGPCRAALPDLAKLAKERAADVVVIGVHDSKRGSDKMVEVAKGAGVEYSLSIDDGGRSEKAWKVSFWPTIAVIDRSGNLRAIGLQPDKVGDVVAKLVKEPAPAAAAVPAETISIAAAVAGAAMATPPSAPAASNPPTAPTAGPAASLHERFCEAKPGERRSKLDALVAAGTPPPISSPEWINSEALTLADLKGKVVVLDFWATWCGPCIASIPHANELHEKYKDKVVFIGVCHPRGGEQMAAKAKDKGIKYPICRLTDEKVLEAYAVDSFPDYYFVDKTGKLRVADCRNGQVDELLAALVAE